MFNSKENGFSLIELIIVLIITAILAQLGFTAFNRYARRTRAFAAKTALKNIQRECESNRDLGLDSIFTLLEPKGYGIKSRNTNSCLGEIGSGLISAVPNISNDYPSYFYDFNSGEITCDYQNLKDPLFKECINLPPNNSEKFGPNSGLSCREVNKNVAKFSRGHVYLSGMARRSVAVLGVDIIIGNKKWRVDGVRSPIRWNYQNDDRWLKAFAKKAESVINESEGNFSAEIDKNNPGSLKIYGPTGKSQNNIELKIDPTDPNSPANSVFSGTNPYAYPALNSMADNFHYRYPKYTSENPKEIETTTVCDGR
tara:strand:+ start:2529 stop:3464 length:936 start_codon:yes stop_codon:yes gene_type:complete